MLSKQAYHAMVAQSPPSPMASTPPFLEQDSPFFTLGVATRTTLSSPVTTTLIATAAAPVISASSTNAPLATTTSAATASPLARTSLSTATQQIVPTSTLSSFESGIPAAYYVSGGRDTGLHKITDVQKYVELDLDLRRLDQIHKHLWLAGLPTCARPLHQQICMERTVVVTEKTDQHLVWIDNRVFIKPLPEYLMNFHQWTKVLTTTTEQNARGLLLSYMWLVCFKSDFRIAHDQGLLPEEVTWPAWVKFSKAVLSNIDPDKPTRVNPRFLYGELRMTRLNHIYRICSRTRSLKTFIRGYNYGYHQYSSFVQRNFAWFLTVVVYITVVLTAMQVGSFTDELRTNRAFMRASYVFTVFSILAPLGVGGSIAVIVTLLVINNAFYTLGRRREAQAKHRDLLNEWNNANALHSNSTASSRMPQAGATANGNVV